MFALVISGTQSNTAPSLQAVQSRILRHGYATYTHNPKWMEPLKANFKGMNENLVMNCFSQLSALIADIITLNISNLSELRMMTYTTEQIFVPLN